jgi:2-polyprenyl-3-methyl-5-hydroxy-6-metoxy-1,4-benzoquinol methylase
MKADYFEENRKAWNLRTTVHKDSTFYDVAGFKAGNTSLNRIELEELGPVTGKRLLHLQCHFGMDTLSWARLGADATGIDISDEAIKEAEALKQELGLNARFERSNVYDLKENLQGQFDIVFTSYGVVGWLPDLNKWAEIIAHFLKPGGTFYLAEFHPVVWMFDNDFKEIRYAYHNTPEPIVEESTGTYADRSAPIRYKEYSWNHSLSEVVTALLDHGLRLDHLHEFPYSPYNCFSHTVQGPDGFWRIQHLQDLIPIVYTIKATKV